MQIIYAQSSISHNPAETVGDGSYRAANVSRIGSIVEKIPFDPMMWICKVHSERHVRKVKGACRHGATIAEISARFGTFEAAVTAAGLAVMAAQSFDFAVTRPPGHHAGRETAAGFCLFNNVAIAGTYHLEQGRRVAIIDFDGHFGNGTQKIFARNPSVFYASIHEEGGYASKAIGSERSLIIPVPAGSSDDILKDGIGVVATAIANFGPDVIAVSAGFDGYFCDALLSLKYTAKGFYEAGRMIAGIGFPVFAVLEGGYHHYVPDCIAAFVAGVNGSSFTGAAIAPTTSSADALVRYGETIARIRRAVNEHIHRRSNSR